MLVISASEKYREDIVQLLEDNDLPWQDLPASLEDFYLATEQDKLVAVIGTERYGLYALLRSLVVHPGFRKLHVAEKLVNMLEERAIASGIEAIFLLTETAEKYFAKKAYQVISREEVPDEIRSSSEFSHVCAVTAVVMKKSLAKKNQP
ncbi:MAG: arsenic resistance N-acetyltransferase ArsN2 [Flavisolibacter sp.]